MVYKRMTEKTNVLRNIDVTPPEGHKSMQLSGKIREDSLGPAFIRKRDIARLHDNRQSKL